MSIEDNDYNSEDDIPPDSSELESSLDHIIKNIKSRNADVFRAAAMLIYGDDDNHSQSICLVFFSLAAEFGDEESHLYCEKLMAEKPHLVDPAVEYYTYLWNAAYPEGSPHRPDLPPSSEERSTHDEQHDGNEVRE